jgi:hypothetical protein
MANTVKNEDKSATLATVFDKTSKRINEKSKTI